MVLGVISIKCIIYSWVSHNCENTGIILLKIAFQQRVSIMLYNENPETLNLDNNENLDSNDSNLYIQNSNTSLN